MKLRNLYSANEFILSFEVFPPKDDLSGEKTSTLVENLNILKKYNPKFISVTYGAGGSCSDKSYELVKMFKNDLQYEVMSHLTCVNASFNSIKKYIDELISLRMENILALRGDIPQGMTSDCFDFKYASDLVAFIKAHYKDKLDIAVAGYPEGHIESESLEKDLSYLRNKIYLGADVVFTQLFFDNSKFLNFAEKVNNFSPNIPIVAGIMPIISYKQIERMLSLANVTIPEKLKNGLEKFKDNSDDIKKLGIDYVTEQCQELIDNGVKNFHFFTLNLAKSSSKILDNLNIATAK